MSTDSRKALRYYLMLTALVCGGLVMLLELLGSRVVGPFFGVGLFVWTSLIAVALVALALGYSVGGWLADQRRDPAWLYSTLILTGVLVLLIPLVQDWVLKACQPLGLRLGTLVSSLVLFGPPLFLLGFVSPYVVKIATDELRIIGKTVGRFYALSTLGSGLGTLLTGFVLIPALGVKGIFILAGSLLLVLGVGYFLIFRRIWWPALLLPLPLLTQPPQPVLQGQLADGTRVQQVAEVDSYYGKIKVLDYSFGTRALREMTIDGLIQGGMDLNSGLSVYGYSYLLQALPWGLNPKGERALMIGLGAGLVPGWYNAQGVTTDVVDIDPRVVELARRHFDFETSGEVHIRDARYQLIRSARRYDYLLLDVFSGDTTPGHLLSSEAMALVAERLTPEGVFAANLVGDLGERTQVAESIKKTVARHFDQVRLFPTFDPQDSASGNYVLVAYQGPPRRLQLPRMRVHSLAREELRQALEQPFKLPVTAEALVLTDNYNPLEFMDAPVREDLRRSILSDADADMLL